MTLQKSEKMALLAEIDALVKQHDEDELEASGNYDLINMQGDLLRGVVEAIRGAPREDHRWSHHDAVDLVLQLRTQRDNLRAFANAIFEGWPDLGTYDGFDLQQLGEQYGLLDPHEVTEICGDNCNCAEYGEFPTTCYRKSALLKDQAPS